MTSTLQTVDLDKIQKTARTIRESEWRKLAKSRAPTMSERLDALDSAIEIERAVLRATADRQPDE